MNGVALSRDMLMHQMNDQGPHIKYEHNATDGQEEGEGELDQDEEFFEAGDKDLTDKNIVVNEDTRQPYDIDDGEYDDQVDNQPEDQDIDQSSLENDEIQSVTNEQQK